MATTSESSMYRLPMYYDYSEPIPLPTCMYSLPSYIQITSTTEVKELSLDECTPSPDLQCLENRQETILCELNGLKAAVEEMASTLGVSLPRQKHTTILSTQDFVISASPTNPPLLVCALQHIMLERGQSHSTASFVHSSVRGGIPDNVKTLFQNFSTCKRLIGRPPVVLTLLWKEDGDLPCLVASSCSHTPLIGELTIARFLCRTFLPDLYGSLTADESAAVDHWIDLWMAGGKEKAAAKQGLNTKLASQEWVVVDKMTLADVVLACSMVKDGGINSMSDSVKKWLKRIPGLSSIVEVIVTTPFNRM